MGDNVASSLAPTAFSEALWDTETAAKFVGKSPKSLESDRVYGRGLPYIRLGRTIRYDPAIVRAYLVKRTISPSDEAA